MKLWIYKHYKWNLYEVLYIAKHTETLEELVVYKALYNSAEFWNNAIWIRPKDMFQENVEINWVVSPRFTYIWDKKIDWFDKDPCIINWWRKTDQRNVSWTANWIVHHRIDSSTSLFDLGWTSSSRCAWMNAYAWFFKSRVDAMDNYYIGMFSWLNPLDYQQWIQTNELYIR